jgi:hypothetical protein
MKNYITLFIFMFNLAAVAQPRLETVYLTIFTSLTEKVFKRLEKIQQESGCQSFGEVARMILSGELINCFYRDVSLNAPMEEMALIRKELKAIRPTSIERKPSLSC